MKRILCYGDSNTWGYNPATLDRFDEHTRWTRVLGKALGNGYEVIDLGVMVPWSKILETAIEHKADMIGLSGLITPSPDEILRTMKELFSPRLRRAITTPS